MNIWKCGVATWDVEQYVTYTLEPPPPPLNAAGEQTTRAKGFWGVEMKRGGGDHVG